MTLENVAFVLSESGIDVSFDVIGKQLSLSQNGKPFSEMEAISLTAEYGMNSPYLLPFVGELGMRRPVNPVAAWIKSKEWDGKDRLPEILATVQVAEDYPVSLRDTLLHRWLLSATAAAMLTDRKFSSRGVLTLQGPQGIGKTTWITRLITEQVLRDRVIKRDHHMDGGSKDSILSAIRHWIVEIGELDGAFRKDIARLKGFLTNDCDKVRPPYGKVELEYARRTVFAATVNDATFLVDPTGNSRFWTIAVEALDYTHSIDMQQLFAQLNVEFREGTQWWLTAAEEQALATYNLRHRAVSAIAEKVMDHLDLEAASNVGTFMTPTELLKEIGLSNPTNNQARECGAVLREIFGAPKRIQGRNLWRIAAKGDFQLPVKVGLPRVDPEDEF